MTFPRGVGRKADVTAARREERSNSMRTFVLGKDGTALMPCHPARARELLKTGQAVVHRVYPFVIRLKERVTGDVQPIRIKLDPGSKATGMAVVREAVNATVVISLFELMHRGRQISEALTSRRSMRRVRRNRNTRYREARFNNRTKAKGWLAPSLQHRVDTTMSWVGRMQRWAPITGLAQELVRFDMQLIQNPEISGVEYQQGELVGYELREYLLEKWNRQCAYCDAKDTPLQIEHIHPKAKGGSNRASNLTIACHHCNQKKAAFSIAVFLAKDPVRLKRIESRAKAPLKDAAAVNTTRWALFNALKGTGLPVEVGTGGNTKWNRSRLGVPKTHALDALCVGNVIEVKGWVKPALTIKCTGRGAYQRTRLTAKGGIRGYLTRKKQHFGFQTGDMVKANVPKGKKTGLHVGRVAVRKSGNFDVQTPQGVVQGISHKHCTVVQRADGYGYSFNRATNTGREQARPKATDASHPLLYLPGMNARVSRAF